MWPRSANWPHAHTSRFTAAAAAAAAVAAVAASAASIEKREYKLRVFSTVQCNSDVGTKYENRKGAISSEETLVNRAPMPRCIELLVPSKAHIYLPRQRSRDRAAEVVTYYPGSFARHVCLRRRKDDWSGGGSSSTCAAVAGNATTTTRGRVSFVCVSASTRVYYICRLDKSLNDLFSLILSPQISLYIYTPIRRLRRRAPRSTRPCIVVLSLFPTASFIPPYLFCAARR